MADRPILFSTPMIRALLEGRKTMTRRVLKPQPAADFISADIGREAMAMKPAFLFGSETHRMLGRLTRPGDRLWCRETWGSKQADHTACCRENGYRKPMHGDDLVYMANPADAYQWGRGLPSQGGFMWRPSIHMPRWASRLTLIVESVKVERLKDISEADAWAEGVTEQLAADLAGEAGAQSAFAAYMALNDFSAAVGFSVLWDSIHGPGAWDANPWVVAIGFSVVRANIDSLPPAPEVGK